MLIDQIAKDVGISLDRSTCRARTGQAQLEGQPVLLAKPQTFMNQSGAAVACLVASLNIPLNQLLVIVDDLALPLGKLRLRPKGSDGGHNGLKSIIEALGTERFARLRLGIHPLKQEIQDTVQFVLSPFAPDEWETVYLMVERGQMVIQTVLREGLDQAMAKYN